MLQRFKFDYCPLETLGNKLLVNMEYHPTIPEFEVKATIRYEVLLVSNHIFRDPISLLHPHCEDLLLFRD